MISGAKGTKMMRSILTCTAFALFGLLSGCGGPGQPAKQSAATQQNESQAQLQALPEAARNAVFIRAIRDAGFDCQHVTESRALAGTEGAWAAQCDDGTPYVIAIAPNGQAQVTKGAPSDQVAPNAA